MSTTPEKLTRGQQWTVNSLNRRKRIIESGGRRLVVMLDKEYNDLLGEVMAHRHKTDHQFSLTDLVKKMIVAEHKQINRRARATPKSVRRAARSNAPSER